MKWLGFSLIIVLVAFAINKDYCKQPNQLLSITNSQSTSVTGEKVDVVDQIQRKLQALGVAEFTIEYAKTGAISIRYYSTYKADFIQSYLDEDFQVTVDFISESNTQNTGFDGVIIVERKNEVNRNLHVHINGVLKSSRNSSEDILIKNLNALSGFSQNSYSNTEHNTANVRAGPCV